MIIRKENKNDYKKVYTIAKNAFESAEHRDGKEQDLIVKLRSSKAFIPELSLVAEIDDEVVGHIMFTKNNIGLTLAPLSVSPKFQKRGVGTELIKEGHAVAKNLNYRYIIVLGSEKYYPKFGYIPATKLGVKSPFDVSEKNFMAIDLDCENTPINSMVEYPKEFGI